MQHSSIRFLMALALFITAFTASAQSYPAKPVRIVSAFAPGGTNDVIARIISQKLTELLDRKSTRLNSSH